jgi:hypothetical protein
LLLAFALLVRHELSAQFPFGRRERTLVLESYEQGIEGFQAKYLELLKQTVAAGAGGQADATWETLSGNAEAWSDFLRRMGLDDHEELPPQ